MNRAKPSSSKSLPSTSATSSHSSATGTDSDTMRQSRKRPAPSSSTLLSSNRLMCNGVAGKSSDSLDAGKYADLSCPICMETINEPTSTHCGHTYCRECIVETIRTNTKCPKCGVHLTVEKLCPNFALSDFIARSRTSTAKVVKAEIFESSAPLASSAPPSDVVKLLTNVNYEHLNLNDLDKLLKVLQRRRESMASDDEECKRKLLHEFLTQLLKIKNACMDKLTQEMTLINQDISVVRTSNVNNGIDTDSPASTSNNHLNVESYSSSSGIGFNTQPLKFVQQEHQSLSARKKRMYNHFDELCQVYFDSRSADVLDNRSYDATVPNGPAEDEEMEVLGGFGKTLSHITQYHSLKPLATLSYSADMLSISNSNIVSSIEFDKDNEFFAIAGVTKKIKLFEYVNVIGSAVDIHCPSAELSCNAKISCVAWSNYYKNSLASSDYDGCVSLWDVTSCARVRSLGEHEKRVWSVDWSSGDPRLLASGSDDSKVKLWSTNCEKSIANLEAKANVCCVKFCPESTYVIAFGSADHCVHYYDFRKPREPLGVLFGHKKAVSYVKFASKDELVSASTDSNLKLWNLNKSMNCIRSFTGHINEKNFVGLATDGNYIACGSENNSLYLYYKFLPKPLFSFKFENHRNMLERPKQDEAPEFVSAVAWKKGSPVVVAANSQGAIKILELV